MRRTLAVVGFAIVFLLISTALLMHGQVDVVGKGIAVADSPVVFVVPAQYSGDDADSFIADSLTRELVVGLMAVEGVVVMAPQGGPEGLQQASNLDSYALAGTIYQEASKVRLIVTLSDSRSGRYVWSWTLRGDLARSDLLSIQAQMAAQVIETFTNLCGPANSYADRSSAQVGGSCNLATLVASK